MVTYKTTDAMEKSEYLMGYLLHLLIYVIVSCILFLYYREKLIDLKICRALFFALLMLFIGLYSQAFADILYLPTTLETIDDEAFMNDPFIVSVIFPENLKNINSRAFAYSGLKTALLPEDISYIADDAFEGIQNSLEIMGYPSSYAERWCERNNVLFTNLMEQGIEGAEVDNGITGITLSQSSVTLYPENWSNVVATVNGTSENKGVSWYINDDSIAQIVNDDENHQVLIFPEQVGVARVTAMSDGNPNITASFQLTVQEHETLEAPSRFSGYSFDCTGIDLQWRQVSGAEYYEIYRSVSPDSNYQLIAKVQASRFSPLYFDTGLSASTTYYYKVKAVSRIGVESPLSEYYACTTADAPAAPDNVSVTAYSNGISISWDAVEQTTIYNIYRSTSASSTSFSLLGSCTDTVYFDKTAQVGKIYYYKVSSECVGFADRYESSKSSYVSTRINADNTEFHPDGEQIITQCTLTLSSSQRAIGSGYTGQLTFDVTCDGDFSVSVSNPTPSYDEAKDSVKWATAKRNGDTVAVTISRGNYSQSEREGIITVTCDTHNESKTFLVTQAATAQKAPVFSVYCDRTVTDGENLGQFLNDGKNIITMRPLSYEAKRLYINITRGDNTTVPNAFGSNNSGFYNGIYSRSELDSDYQKYFFTIPEGAPTGVWKVKMTVSNSEIANDPWAQTASFNFSFTVRNNIEMNIQPDEWLQQRFDYLRQELPNGKYWNNNFCSNSPIKNVTFVTLTGGAADQETCYSTTACPSSEKSTGFVHHSKLKETTRYTCNTDPTNAGAQCNGFMRMISAYLTGKQFTRWLCDTSPDNLNHLQPGDIVQYTSNINSNKQEVIHYVMVTSVGEDQISIFDCNSDSHCVIAWRDKSRYSFRKYNSSVKVWKYPSTNTVE